MEATGVPHGHLWGVYDSRVLNWHRLRASLSKAIGLPLEKPGPIPSLIVTESSAAETPSPAADAVNRCVDWELTKVLVEMDIRNPSPEHEAFLREYDCTQNGCEKGE